MLLQGYICVKPMQLLDCKNMLYPKKMGTMKYTCYDLLSAERPTLKHDCHRQNGFRIKTHRPNTWNIAHVSELILLLFCTHFSKVFQMSCLLASFCLKQNDLSSLKGNLISSSTYITSNITIATFTIYSHQQHKHLALTSFSASHYASQPFFCLSWVC